MVGPRNPPLRLPQREREGCDPQDQADVEPDEDRGAELTDEDEPRGEPPEERGPAREPARQGRGAVWEAMTAFTGRGGALLGAAVMAFFAYGAMKAMTAA